MKFTRSIRNIALFLIGFILLSTESFAYQVMAGDTCNASFTVALDTTSGLPVYLFEALDNNPNKQYTWEIEGKKRTTGSVIEHIFDTDANGLIELKVNDGITSCSTEQSISVTPPSPDSCFFNLWKTGSQSVAVETWLSAYSVDRSYTLNFGDGTEVEEDPAFRFPVYHTYDAGGTYEICQTMNLDSCTYCKTVEIPVLASDTCANFAVTFDDSDGMPVYTFTAQNDDPDKQYLWNIGGSLNRNAGSEIDHIFFDGGTWDVTLTVIVGLDSCSSSSRVSANPPSPDQCFFNVWKTDSQTVAIETWMHWYTDLSYTMSFGDGTGIENDSEFGVPVTHTYDSEGTYQICQTMNEDSCTYCKEVTVIVPDTTSCDASYTYTFDSLNSQRYTFFPYVIDSTHQYLWTIEGGFQSTDVPFVYAFPDGGLWRVDLEVITPTDTCKVTQQVFVEQQIAVPCDADYSYTVDSLNSQGYTFLPNVIDSTHQYLWTIEGGFQSSEVPFVYAFPDGGLWRVDLEVFTTTDTCKVTQQVFVAQQIVVPCDASFTFEVDSTKLRSYAFKPTTLDSGRSYLWYVDNRYVSDSSSLNYTFPDSGLFTVRLDVLGLADSCTTSQELFVPLTPSDTTVTDTTMIDTLSIKGTLLADLVPINGLLDLYKKSEDVWEKVTTTNSLNGEYAFTGLAKGTYMIHARGEATSYADFIPTYFVNGVDWVDAYTIDLTGAADDLNITLIRSANLSSQGVGSVSGQLSGLVTTEDEYVLLLKDPSSRNVMKWTVSDKNTNNFRFENLPYGEYKIMVECPGKTATRSISITESTPSVSMDLMLDDNVTGLDFDREVAVKVYPTFIEESLHVRNESGSVQDLMLTMRSLSGKELFTEQVKLPAGETFTKDLSGVGSGIKILQLTDQHGTVENIRLIKK
ncbi:MAG: hypothetical protein AAGA66_17540 [Bacteroidota bacterium]